MDLRLQLFVRRHRTGFVTAQLVGDPDLVVYAPTLDEALEDLELAISDRVERTHPRYQSTFSAPLVFRLETLEFATLVPVFDEGRTLKPGEISVLVAENRAWRTLYVPRLQLHYFVPVKGVDWREVLREVIGEHLETTRDDARLALRIERGESLEPLSVDARPPPLSAFSGKRRTLRTLPVQAEQDELEEAEAEAEAALKQNKKGAPTPTLDTIGVPLSRLAEAQRLPRAVGRHDEVSQLLRMLEASAQTCVAVVGPSGVGKSAVLDELVHRLRDSNLQERLRRRPVWFVDASRLVAGQGFFGDWQRQTFDVIEEAEAVDAIWYVGSILPLLDAGKHIGSELNVSQLLKPYLAGRRLTVIGEASEREWGQLEARDVGFSRLFMPFRLGEPAPPRVREILEGVAAAVAEDDGVEATKDGLDAVEELCRRYSEGSQLGAAARLLRRAAESAVAAGVTRLGRPEVVSHFSQETGLPELLLRDDLPLDPREVERAFAARLVGQEEAVRRMADLVAVIKGGLSDLSRPLGGFLFVGPTGVGKTETAKALAQYLFASEERLLRFDMSEYVGPDAIHRFLGTRSEEGKLVEGIRKQPFSVVLLDEIEKADPAIFDVLLQVLGEARLTDEAGRTADFKNAVVILTSNLGVESFSSGVGIDRAPTAQEYHAHFVQEAERFFRPELFNRLDHVISFSPLEADAISRITARELDKLRRREGLHARGISLELDEGVQPWLAARGVDPRYGARPLKRVIDRSLAMPLAKHLAQHREDRAVRVRPDGDTLAFERASTTFSVEHARVKERVGSRLAALDDTRYRLARWMGCPAYRELEQQLRLLDQLSKNKHFWSDRARAEARTKTMQAQLDLREAFEGLQAQLAGLEDVALEAHFELDAEPLGMIDEDLAAAQARLSEAELALFSTRYEQPNAAWVYLRPHEGAERVMGRLLDAYAELAVERGWTVRAHGALELPPDEASTKVRADRPKGRPKPKERGAPIEKPKKAKPRGPRRFQWEHLGPRLDPVWLEKLEADSPGESPGATFARAVVSDRTERHPFLALEVRGPWARAWLAFEDGLHVELRAERLEVRVCVTEPTATAAHPIDLPWSTRLRRLVDDRRGVIEDPQLEQRVSATSRLLPGYRKLMRAGMYVATFGARGSEWAKRWGAS